MRVPLNRAIAVAIVSITAASPALSQSSSPVQLQEVVVTAQKVKSRLQETPLALSVVTGESLKNQQAKSLEDVSAELPSLSVSRQPNTATIAIRGVGSVVNSPASDSRVATYVDDFYIPRPWQALSQLFDVSRIEYVEGPQGTLYGQDATAGVVNFVTNDPSSHPEGHLTLTGGNYATFGVDGAGNIPIDDHWSARIAGTYNTHGGFDKNLADGKSVNNLNVGAIRGKLKYQSDNFSAVLAADYGDESDQASPYVYVGEQIAGITPAAILLGGKAAALPNISTDSFVHLGHHSRFRDVSMSAKWSFGQNDITAIAGYGTSSMYVSNDLDGTNLAVTRLDDIENGRQGSVELKFDRTTTLYDVIAGVYFFHESVFGATSLPLSTVFFGVPLASSAVVQGIFTGGKIDTDASAAFLQARWHFSSKLYLEVGGRYSYAKDSADQMSVTNFLVPYSPANEILSTANAAAGGTAPCNPSGFISLCTLQQAKSYNSVNPKATIGFQPTPNVLAYGTYATGFQAGGFNMGALQSPFKPETLVDYELGVKLTSENRRLEADVAAYDYHYSNMQVFEVTGPVISIINAAKSRISGVELQVRSIPLTGLVLDLTGDYLHAYYSQFFSQNPELQALYANPPVQNLSGYEVTQSPRYQWGTDVTYTRGVGPGQISIRGQATWTARQYFTQFNQPVNSAGPHTQVNTFLTYNLNEWSLELYCRNLTNRRFLTYANPTSDFFGNVAGVVSDPRTEGVSITRSW